MGGPETAPQSPQRSGRPGKAVAPLVNASGFLARVGAGDDAVDAPGAAFLDQLVDRFDGAAVLALDVEEEVELAGVAALAAVDVGAHRARDLRIAAAHHGREARGVEHVVDRARGEAEGRLEVVAAERLELLQDDPSGLIDVGIALGGGAAGEQQRGQDRRQQDCRARPGHVATLPPSGRLVVSRAMRATLLGTGSPPPNPKRRGPATLVTVGDADRFLVDAGSGVGVQLVQAGVRPYDWPPVFITHHHSDHVIDLGHLLVTRWITGQNAPFEVWGPAGTKRQMDKLLDYLDWDIEIRRAHMTKRDRPRVAVTEIEEGKILEAGGVTVSAFGVDHDPVKPAFGYRFEGGGRRIAISGDTRPSENLIRWSQGVDCLIHECCEMSKTSWFPGCGWPTLEAKIKGLASYHTQPEDIGRVAKDANPGKLVITHMMPGSVPAELEAAAKRQYAGPVTI